MSEKITRLSAGVKSREIDLSAVSSPSPIKPEGIPAGVIGTSKTGPAFVPVTVPNSTEFINKFGDSAGNELGPIAVREWLKNSKAATFIRILGAGDGKASSSGLVTNAGFYVGSQQVQSDGDIGDNPYANGTISTTARTYFVGCLMSESNGSTFLSDSGLQSDYSGVIATAIFQPEQFMSGAIEVTDIYGTTKAYVFHTGTNGDPVVAHDGVSAGVLVNSDGARVEDLANNFISALADADGHNGTITAEKNTTTYAVTMSQGLPGDFGNKSISYLQGGATSGVYPSTLQDKADAFSGGSSFGGPVPLVRGVIFAPQGINLKLKQSAADAAPGIATVADALGPNGSSIGSITNGHQATMFLNGFKGSIESDMSIEFSFDPDSPQYLSNVLNTDPLKIEEKGHYLYADFPVYRSQAVATGSNLLRAGNWDSDGEPIAFLLTGSNSRGTGTASQPDFETFEVRYQTAFSPMFISQDMGTRHNLFKVSALSDGLGAATSFKICIQNIKPSTDPQYEYGTFDLLVRKFDDSDLNPVILESHTDLSLDPDAENYICKIIGDQNIRFNFEDSIDSQSIVVEGDYSNRSKYIRIVPSQYLKIKQTPAAALPFGFRGHYHLQTSGSSLADSSEIYSSMMDSVSIGNKPVQPPIPMIQRLTVGTVGSGRERLNSNIYWGPQFTKIQDVSDPNKSFTNSKSISNFTKYFVNVRSDSSNMWVGENENASVSSDFGIVNADLFNKNLFSLDHIKVITGSDTYADPKEWKNAVYVRGGNIPTNDADATRALSVSDLSKTANRKYGKFTCFLQGGFDGVNIFDPEKSKLTNVAAHREFINENTQGGTNGPTIASYRKAIDIMATDADVDIQLLAIPGQRNQGVTDYAISAVESRFDAMYIMDLEEKDGNNEIVTGSLQTVNIENTISNLKNRGVNTSFAATYFPDVIVRHPDRATNLKVPPSVVALGAFSKNDVLGHPWFAPAGFNRTSLPSVIESTMALKQENLDSLYDTKINPITSFSGTNLVIWGQKTLQQSANALDRINVRRLLIEIRRLVRDASNQIIFEPNRESTLVKFRELVNPILQNVQDNQGLTRYKVIIDTTTTTQADVENNTIRGKILLQPTKTIEFVALDFVVTNNGTEI